MLTYTSTPKLNCNIRMVYGIRHLSTLNACSAEHLCAPQHTKMETKCLCQSQPRLSVWNTAEERYTLC